MIRHDHYSTVTIFCLKIKKNALSVFEKFHSHLVTKMVEFSLLFVKVIGRNLSVMFIFLALVASFFVCKTAK